MGFFSRIFRHSKKPAESAGQLDFAGRFHRFKLFLSSHFEAYSELLEFEERLSNPHPFGMAFLRTCTARLTVGTMQGIMQINTLSGGRFASLQPVLSSLMHRVQAIMRHGAEAIEGPYALSNAVVNTSHRHLVSSGITSLAVLYKNCPDLLAPGFTITAAAWWKYMDQQDILDELDRLMVISQDDPDGINAASARMQDLVRHELPLPEDIQDAIRERFLALGPAVAEPGWTLLVRTLPVQDEHSALSIADLRIHTPCSPEELFQKLTIAFARMYQARAIVYRLKLGVRHRGMPFCWSLHLLPRDHARGSAHPALEESTPGRVGESQQEGIQIHVRGSFTDDGSTSPKAEVASATGDGHLLRDCARALASLQGATGRPHEIFWASGPGCGVDSTLGIMGASPLACPPKAGVAAALEVASPFNNDKYVHRLEGGCCTFPGIAHGGVYYVRNMEDALLFPLGAILMTPKAAPRWSFLLHFAQGVVAGDGSGHGRFARTARRFGRPTILNLPGAVEAFHDGEEVCLAANSLNPCVMGCAAEHSPVPETGGGPAPRGEGLLPDTLSATDTLAGPPSPLDGLASGKATAWIMDSDIGRMARELAPLLLPVTLPDSDSPDFQAANCATFHDLLHYSYDQAVREMFRVSNRSSTADVPAKQLVTDVPKQFWVINLGDGFTEEVRGPAVSLSQIASIPMQEVWNGFVAKPWQGPPQIDTKGLVSIFFEATINPSLDPAVQSTRYAEKNLFLIARRYCSLRCRFGFHFLSLDSFISERERERFIIFRFKGGAANISRRIRRVHFVAELLGNFSFTTEVTEDTLTARLEQGSEKECMAALRLLGYLFMHTRQLDMIMGDEQALASHRMVMLKDMSAVYEGRTPEGFHPDNAPTDPPTGEIMEV